MPSRTCPENCKWCAQVGTPTGLRRSLWLVDKADVAAAYNNEVQGIALLLIGH